MSERGDTRVELEAFSQNVFDVIGTNWLEIGIMSAFGDDDDRFTLPNLTVLEKQCVRWWTMDGRPDTYAFDRLTHVVFP